MNEIFYTYCQCECNGPNFFYRIYWNLKIIKIGTSQSAMQMHRPQDAVKVIAERATKKDVKHSAGNKLSIDSQLVSRRYATRQDKIHKGRRSSGLYLCVCIVLVCVCVCVCVHLCLTQTHTVCVFLGLIYSGPWMCVCVCVWQQQGHECLCQSSNADKDVQCTYWNQLSWTRHHIRISVGGGGGGRNLAEKGKSREIHCVNKSLTNSWHRLWNLSQDFFVLCQKGTHAWGRGQENI